MNELLQILTIQDVSPSRFAKIESAAKEQFGEAFTSSTGNVQKEGVEISYSYDGSNLTLSILKAPKIFGHYIDSPADISEKLMNWIDSIQ